MIPAGESGHGSNVYWYVTVNVKVKFKKYFRFPFNVTIKFFIKTVFDHSSYPNLKLLILNLKSVNVNFKAEKRQLNLEL